MTDDGEPFKAGIYASFDGFLAVPEPATWAILLLGLSAAGVVRRRTLQPRERDLPDPQGRRRL
jgi:PEP-CTERM motif-containing protein